MAGPSHEAIEQRWRNWLVERNRVGARFALWLVIVLYPLFGVLDYVVAPPASLPLLWGTRAFVTLYTLVMFAILGRPVFRRYATLLTSFYVVAIAGGICAMVAAIGGLITPYYAGISLVMVGAGLLFVWPRTTVLATYGVILVMYVLPNVFDVPPGEAPTALSNVFFFSSMAVVIAAGQVLQYSSLRRQLVTRLTLETTKADLETAHEKLKEVDRYRTRFFGNITHELRTPLTLILSPVDAILQGQVGDFSPEQSEYLHGIQRNGMKLLRLINDILDLVKLEESHLSLRVSRFDIRERLADIVRVVQPLAERKALTVGLGGDDAPDDTWVDPEQFERVVVNLLSNAIKFTSEGGVVLVRLETLPDAVRVTVEDTGVGIPEDQLSRVFDRFTQVDDSLTRRHGGTGIGLALVREILELHGGTIEAHSTLGEGTRMTFQLPRGRSHFREDVVHFETAPPPVAETEESGEVRGLREWMEQIRTSESYRFLAIEHDTDRRAVRRDPKEQLKTRKVLVVDDNRDMLEFLQFQLHGRFRVYAATDGEKGWEVIKRERPDIIVSDYMMPAMDGMELCARIKADPETRHIPVVLLSAKAEVEDRVRGAEVGADAYLAKPFRPQELLAVIENNIRAGEAMADALLEKRMRSLDLLSAGLAHEIRNPLTYIQNGLFMLRQGMDRWVGLDRQDEAGREKLRKRMEDLFSVAEKGVRRIDGVVELIKEYAQEGTTVTERDYAIDEAVRRTLPLLAPYRPKPHTIHQDLQAPRAKIWVIPEQLHQVLTGLVQNALDAIPDGGNVWVSTRAGDGRVRLMVRDDGPGIPADVRRDIFSPFFSTKAPGEGMGLGLTIVHRVVTRVGGSVEIDSDPGLGTLFTVELPTVPAGVTHGGTAPDENLRGAI